MCQSLPSRSNPRRLWLKRAILPLTGIRPRGRNIVWSVELGNEVYGSPVVAGDVVYVGADNTRQINPAFQEDSGVLMAFRATDGAFLWQDVAPRVERGLREWLLPSTTSAPMLKATGCTTSPPSVNSVASTRRVSAMVRTMVHIGKRSSKTRCSRHRLATGHARLGCLSTRSLQ
jgi:hypothetical protein